MAALGVAESSTGYDPCDFAGATQGLHLLRRASSRGDVSYRYTPGHRDVFGNELVDAIAKMAARGVSLGRTSLPQASKWLVDGAPYLPWFAAVCRSLRAQNPWPAFDGSPVGPLPGPSVGPDELLQPFLPAPAARGSSRRTSPRSGADSAGDIEEVRPFLQVKIASYNALSLAAPRAEEADRINSEGIAYKVARPALLARCLRDAGVDMASVQESRCAQGTLTTGDFFRICSGAEGGSFGTEWWFRVGHPLLQLGRRRVCLNPHQLVVHHASPRRLLVSLEPGHTKLFMLALHAPHRGAETHIISEWWEATMQICNQYVQDSECIIAGDMNAAIGSVCTPQVGDWAAEEEDMSGTLFRQLLQQRGAWVPASFGHLHSGQTWTYQQKRNGRLIRPDLIALPHSWWWGDVSSQVEVGIHAGQPAPDHHAVTVSVRATLFHACFPQQRAQSVHRRFDVEAISRPENRERMAAILRSLPDIPWEVSAHSHAQQLVHHLQLGLQEAFPLTERQTRRKHTFLTDASWELHGKPGEPIVGKKVSHQPKVSQRLIFSKNYNIAISAFTQELAHIHNPNDYVT